jgi:hypothetical protein
MLGSAFVGYDYGVSGPFWFAAGCSPMIVFFALLGISCKRKIPEAHTSLEVVRIRYGKTVRNGLIMKANANRTNCPRCLHDTLFDQQHLRLCQYALRCRGSDCSPVSHPAECEYGLTGVGLVCILSQRHSSYL